MGTDAAISPSPPHNLPLPPTALVGRARELELARTALLADAGRLLTLTGPAGVGKTRLALAVAEAVLPAFPHGVWFVDLAAIREAALVPAAVARALGIQEGGARSLPVALASYLSERRLMLVLDNLEQVLPAAVWIAEMLAACAGLTVLATSRARLRLRWERVLPVPPLALPAPDERTPATVASAPAVALFVARVRADDPSFDLTPDNARAVAALCDRLDGLPLAIELAAAQVRLLTPAGLLERLDGRLPALAWDAQDAPPRQRTLRAAIAWSHDLLAPAEQALFRRLAVFVGGWTAPAAAVVADTDSLGLEPLAGLHALVEASLVRVTGHADREPRFGMLALPREFAWDCLTGSGELEACRRRHAAHVAALAARAEVALRGPEQRGWYARLDRERDNLRAALTWAAERDTGEVAPRLAADLAYFWWTTGALSEGRRWLEGALARAPEASVPARVAALAGAGLLAAFLGDHAAATAHLTTALVLARGLGDGGAVVAVLGKLTAVPWLRGQVGQAPDLATELAVWRARADPWHVAFALHGLGLLASEGGELATATAYLEEALALYDRLGDDYRVAGVLGTLAAVAHERGDDARAVALVARALDLGWALGNRRAVAWCSDIALQIVAERAPSAALARQLGAAEGLRAVLGFPRSPRQQARHEQAVAAVRAALGDDAYAAAWSAGRLLPPAHLVEEVLATLAAWTPPAAVAARREAGPLSAREREVLQLVAAGQSNKAIARALSISPTTVNYHVTSLLNKLGAGTRAQAVALAARRGLL